MYSDFASFVRVLRNTQLIDLIHIDPCIAIIRHRHPVQVIMSSTWLSGRGQSDAQNISPFCPVKPIMNTNSLPSQTIYSEKKRSWYAKQTAEIQCYVYSVRFDFRCCGQACQRSSGIHNFNLRGPSLLPRLDKQTVPKASTRPTQAPRRCSAPRLPTPSYKLESCQISPSCLPLVLTWFCSNASGEKQQRPQARKDATAREKTIC